MLPLPHQCCLLLALHYHPSPWQYIQNDLIVPHFCLPGFHAVARMIFLKNLPGYKTLVVLNDSYCLRIKSKTLDMSLNNITIESISYIYNPRPLPHTALKKKLFQPYRTACNSWTNSLLQLLYFCPDSLCFEYPFLSAWKLHIILTIYLKLFFWQIPWTRHWLSIFSTSFTTCLPSTWSAQLQQWYNRCFIIFRYL